MLGKIKSYLKHINPRLLRAYPIITSVAIIGVAMVLFARAAAGSTSINPEDGNKNGVNTITDASAHNGQAIQFGSGAQTADYKFGPSGLTGGGFQNVIAVSPFKDGSGNRPYLLGADVSGIHYSSNNGALWQPRPSPQHVASILWSNQTAGKAFAAADEGLYATTDFGRSWTQKAGAVNFDANGTYLVNGTEHPRPTGNLMAQDTSGATKYLWAATATQGVKQSTDDGASWNAVTLAGNHLRSIASDPNNPDVLYVAILNVGNGDPANNGVWVSTNARSGGMSFTKMTDYPGGGSTPEELWAIDDNSSTKLFVAGGTDGVFMYDGGWSTLNSGLQVGGNGATWESITGYRTAGGTVTLYVGATDAPSVAGTSHRRAIAKSTDGGASWTSISDDPHITLDWTMFGTDVASWMQQISFHNFAGNAQWTASYLALDPDQENMILVAGRGGAWFGNQGDTTTWQPANNGLMVTVNMSVATDPNLPGRLVVGNMDYTMLYSPDGGTTFTAGGAGAAGAETTGDVVVYDSTPATSGPTKVYLSASQRGQNTGTGDIFSNPDPFGGGTWTDEGLPVSTDIPALGVGHDGSNTVILAGTTQQGFWRKSGASWTQVTGGPFDVGGAGNGCFAWKVNTPIVYAFDGSGVWRSNSAGAQGSWVKILAGSAEFGELDALALDPVNSNYLYVSDGPVKRITNAETTTGTGTTTVGNVSGVTNAGPIAVSSKGFLFIHDRNGSKLMRSLDPRAGSPSFSNVSDTYYAELNGNIRSLAVSVDGMVYTAENGSGVTVGRFAP